jgi:hypothetical protein
VRLIYSGQTAWSDGIRSLSIFQAKIWSGLIPEVRVRSIIDGLAPDWRGKLKELC